MSEEKAEPAKVGRPTKYNEEIVEKAKEYVDGGYKDLDHIIPSIAGMALALDLNRDTLYSWANDQEKEFSGILEKCGATQEVKLLNGGLSGDMNASIVKLALGKQGYSDKTETDNTHVLMSHEEWLSGLD